MRIEWLEEFLFRVKNSAMSNDWQRFKVWERVSREEFEDSAWEDKNAVIRTAQLEAVVKDQVSPELFRDIEAGIQRSGMSVRHTLFR